MNCSCPNCKASFNLKDELIGKNLECPNCKTVFTASSNTDSQDSSLNNLDDGNKSSSLTEQGIFGKHKYGIKQKKIAINEKYYVKDEENNDLFFSVRRVHFWRRFFA